MASDIENGEAPCICESKFFVVVHRLNNPPIAMIALKRLRDLLEEAVPQSLHSSPCGNWVNGSCKDLFSFFLSFFSLFP